MFFMVLKGFIYTIVVDIYAFRLAISTISPCILHQNALHLAAKRTAFSTKTYFILLQIAPKRVLVAVVLNKNSFCLHAQLPLFAPKQASARIDFLRQGERLVDKKGAHNVKILAKS